MTEGGGVGWECWMERGGCWMEGGRGEEVLDGTVGWREDDGGMLDGGKNERVFNGREEWEGGGKKEKKVI